jgi:glyoxylase-like metal-dependent hydrolase (beta-lactamase superfamily II)
MMPRDGKKPKESKVFRHFLTDVNESNVFVLACAATRKCIIVDAGEMTEDMAEFIERKGLDVAAVFVTHEHYDHTSGLQNIVRTYNPLVYGAHSYVEGFKAEEVSHGSEITVGDLAGLVLDTSGHTPNAMSLYLPGMVFTGDALFAGSVGGTNSDADKQKQLRLIRENIFTLPPDTEIHTGHGPSSTVAIESRYNPFFQE